MAVSITKHQWLFDSSLRKTLYKNCTEKCCLFNVYYRVGMSLLYRMMQKRDSPILTDETIENIRTMVKRSLTFIENYGPITKDGFTLDGAYTDIITIGDGDFLTENTVWDFKVSKHDPNKDHTLQLLIYYIMGKKSNNPEFKTVRNLGIFNPRLNKVYLLAISDVPTEVIAEVSEEIIAYK